MPAIKPVVLIYVCSRNHRHAVLQTDSGIPPSEFRCRFKPGGRRCVEPAFLTRLHEVEYLLYPPSSARIDEIYAETGVEIPSNHLLVRKIKASEYPEPIDEEELT